MHDILILGAGPAGLSAAVAVRSTQYLARKEVEEETEL